MLKKSLPLMIFLLATCSAGAIPANKTNPLKLDVPSLSGQCRGPNCNNTCQGPQGLPGPTGAVGEVGPQGPAGPAGITGPQGAQGPVGPQGSVGPMGITGTQGSQGPAGNQGNAGSRGPTGSQGATGATGATGSTGGTGPAGDPGFVLGYAQAVATTIATGIAPGAVIPLDTLVIQNGFFALSSGGIICFFGGYFQIYYQVSGTPGPSVGLHVNGLYVPPTAFASNQDGSSMHASVIIKLNPLDVVQLFNNRNDILTVPTYATSPVPVPVSLTLIRLTN